ncbi:protein phosphatase [Colletotrichum truncatum]|uniref:Protein phosphatase n=1 Tax=Colletotrichum truncatum TaxID=5467 RepID=A0ACC3ZGX0_COLTU
MVSCGILSVLVVPKHSQSFTGDKRCGSEKHLMADICPYMCILDDCPKPDMLYVTRKEWTRHVEQEHQQCWQCSPCTVPDRPPLVFPSVDGLLSHLRQEHGSTISESQYSTLVINGTRPVPPGISSCPLCDSTGPPDAPELLDHIAEHLHAFSLRSLPWAMDVIGDEEGDVGDDYFDADNYFDQGSDDQSRPDDVIDPDQDTDDLSSLSSYETYTSSHRSTLSATNIPRGPPIEPIKAGSVNAVDTQPAREVVKRNPAKDPERGPPQPHNLASRKIRITSSWSLDSVQPFCERMIAGFDAYNYSYFG